MGRAMATQVEHSARGIGRKELVVLLAFTIALQALGVDAMLPALDDIAADLQVPDPNRRQLVVGLFLLFAGLGSLIPGLLSDRYGRKILMLVTLGLYVITSFACALVTSYDVLLVARVLQGLSSAGLVVLPAAIVRDQFEGDGMARVLSLIGAVFITVPVIAPTLGQLVMDLANWRWIFVVLGALGMVMTAWIAVRLPETLHPEFRQEIRVMVLLRNMTVAATARSSFGYTIGAGLVIGTVFGYVNSAQQLVGEHFNAGDMFPYVFGGTAATMALSSLVNSRIVERFGARRVSHTGLIIFMVVSGLQVWVAYSTHSTQIEWFLPLMSCNLALLGFLGANFSSIAMQPFAEIAGAASSIQSFVRMVMAAVIGIVIGQAYDGTARPLAISMLSAALFALVLVLFSEKGRLFRRLHARPEGVRD